MRVKLRRALALCAGVLALVAGAELAWPDRVDAGAAPAPGRRAEAQRVAQSPLPALEHYAALVERPLFQSSRRAAPVLPEGRSAAGEAAEAAKPPDEPVLTGVLLNARRRTAVLREPGSTLDVGVSHGEALGDWTVTEITQYGVVLKNRDRVLTLSLPGLAPAR